MGIVFAVIGFLVGAVLGMMGLMWLALGGGRHLTYRDLISRRPIRLLSGLAIIGCGVVMAYFAQGLAC